MKTRLAFLLPLLATAGCTVGNSASVKVSGICLPPSDASSCTFSATCGNQYIGRNAIDIAETNHLWIVIQVDNQLPNNEDLSNFRTNTNDAYVHEYVVEYTGTELPTATAPILGSAVVPASGSTVISVLPIPESIGAVIQANAPGPDAVFGTADDVLPPGSYIDGTAKLRLKGALGDTTSFETGVFEMPIRVCNGCLGVLTCTAPDFPVFCPPNSGQLPLSATCVTP